MRCLCEEGSDTDTEACWKSSNEWNIVFIHY